MAPTRTDWTGAWKNFLQPIYSPRHLLIGAAVPASSKKFRTWAEQLGKCRSGRTQGSEWLWGNGLDKMCEMNPLNSSFLIKLELLLQLSYVYSCLLIVELFTQITWTFFYTVKTSLLFCSRQVCESVWCLSSTTLITHKFKSSSGWASLSMADAHHHLGGLL